MMISTIDSQNHQTPEFSVSPTLPAEKTPSGNSSVTPEPRVGDLGQTATAAGDLVEVVGQQPDDLAEAERDDGQVVAAQPQRRRAEDQTRRSR